MSGNYVSVLVQVPMNLNVTQIVWMGLKVPKLPQLEMVLLTCQVQIDGMDGLDYAQRLKKIKKPMYSIQRWNERVKMSAVAHGPFCSRPAAYFLKNTVIERPQFTKMGVIRCICFTKMGIIRFKYINI